MVGGLTVPVKQKTCVDSNHERQRNKKVVKGCTWQAENHADECPHKPLLATFAGAMRLRD
jgi:hypothetical protein